VQRISRRLGTPVGEHRALRIIHILEETGAIEPAGSYRQHYRRGYPSGFRVRLYRLGTRTARRVQVSVRRRAPRKPWWKHPLFGFDTNRYPSGLPKRLRGWRPHGPPPATPGGGSSSRHERTT